MNRSDKYQLLAQRSALEKMIAETHPDEVLDLKSLQTRLVFVNQQISKLPVDERLPAKAKLTFRGRPVVGSHGIFAEFGLSATKAFADAVSMVAAGLSSPLASTGPIPFRSTRTNGSISRWTADACCIARQRWRSGLSRILATTRSRTSPIRWKTFSSSTKAWNCRGDSEPLSCGCHCAITGWRAFASPSATTLIAPVTSLRA